MDCDLKKEADLPPYKDDPMAPDSTPVKSIKVKHHKRHRTIPRILRFTTLACLSYLVYTNYQPTSTIKSTNLSLSKLSEDLARCAKLKSTPANPIGLGRDKNARHIAGQKPTLIKNAKVWTGEPAEGTPEDLARNGTGYAWIDADVYVQDGLIRAVSSEIAVGSVPKDTLIFDAGGRPVTAGIIDMHSHGGVGSLPELWGSEDVNEMSADITPQMRSIDGFNPLDPQLQVIKSGGVTTSLVLPGSGNNIGGEAYVFKHAVGPKDGRLEISARDMLADPEGELRYMKMACGENAKRVYGRGRTQSPYSRLGESWEFRHAFEQAADLNRRQDDWCAAVEKNGIESATEYLPWDLKWESLGAVLRGQVHVNTHCYTIPDLEAFVDHTNEFKFPVRAFHHAHSTYLVPEILKRAYGPEPPASALFAENMYYKVEAYTASEFAGKILWQNGLTPIYVSDNPVLNAQHVLFEAAKAYKYGLPYHVALASVTTAPAHYLGFGERLGKVKNGYDADIVVWDSDPLSAGAAPVQVWIDGVEQFEKPVVLKKDAGVGKSKKELLADVKEPVDTDKVVFEGVTKVLLKGVQTSEDGPVTVIVEDGKITCLGVCKEEVSSARAGNSKFVKLADGYLTDSITAIGGALGLEEIPSEKYTTNGNSLIFSRALDGLSLDTKKLHQAVNYGVTRAVTAPSYLGVSVGFATGAKHSLEHGAVWNEEVAMHYPLDDQVKGFKEMGSLSVGMATLRGKLLKALSTLKKTEDFENPFGEEAYLASVIRGEKTLVLSVNSADIIASIIRLKSDVEKLIPTDTLKIAIIGAAEAHILAKELAAAQIGVILSPIYSYGVTWDQRRALTGAPLTNGTAVDSLVRAGVKIAFGLLEDWEVRTLGVNAGIALNNGAAAGISEEMAWGFVSSGVYEVLGLTMESALDSGHFIISEGSPLQIESRIKAVGRGSERVLVFE